MARRLFPARFLQLANGDPAVNGQYRLFTDPFAGVEITDIKLSDGVSDPATGSGAFLAGSDGNTPWLRGPDTGDGPAETVVMYMDTGVGVRYEIFAVDAQAETIAALSEVRAFIAANPDGVGSGAGLPAGTTLEQIPNGNTRLAMTIDERVKLNGVEPNATRLLLGDTAGTAKAGNWVPTAAQVGAVASMTPGVRLWFRTAAQGPPTAAEGASDSGTDWVFLENS